MNNPSGRFCGIERLEARRLLSLGGVDSSFSGDGADTYKFEGEQFAYHASSFDFARDGKIIAAATTRGRDSWSQILLIRLNPDGTLDRSFGSNGQAITSLAGPRTGETIAGVKKVLVQTDGKILVAGGLGGKWAVFRFNSDGALDQSFDHDGIQTFGDNAGEAVQDMKLLPSGKILVGGLAEPEEYPSTHSRDFGVMRLKSNGAIDRSFGNKGYVLSDLGYGDRLDQIFVDGAGNILVVGVTNLGNRNDANIVLMRYRGNGSLDTTFGRKGKAVTPLRSRSAAVSSLQTLSDGRILLSGSNNYDGFVMRLDRRGRIDRSFGERGAVSFDLGSTDDRAVVLGVNRKQVLVLGTSGANYYYQPKDSRQFLINLRADGSEAARSELSLTMDGAQQLDSGAKLVGNNRVVALFSSRDNREGGNLTFAQFGRNGAIDSHFGQAGSSTIVAHGPLYGVPIKVVAQPDGKSVVLADIGTYGKHSYSLLRINAGGGLDSSFGKGGRVVLEADPANAYNIFALDGSGKIVVAGFDYETYGLFVQRFSADGSADNTFGDHGRVTVEEGSEWPTQILPLADGKILVGGSKQAGIGEYTMTITRLNGDGSLDKSFGGNGVLADSFSDLNTIDELFVGAGGKLTVVGTGQRYDDMAPASPPTIFIGRYNANGSVDRTFSQDGRIVIDDAGSAYDARLLADGGFVVLARGAGGQEFKLLRYKADGSADGTTVGKAPDRIVKAFFEADGRILILTRSSTVRLAVDGSAIAGSGRGSAIGHGADEVNGEIYNGALAITSDHKLLLAAKDSDGDLTLWRYLLD